MSELATLEHAGSTTPAPMRKPPRISKRVTDAVRLLATGECKTVKAASERVGMNYTHLCEALRKPHIEAFAAREAAGNISRGVLRASARLVELIDADSEHVAAKVSERIAEHGGILKPQSGHSVNVNVTNNLSPGYIIDMTPWQPVAPSGKVVDAVAHSDTSEQDQ